MREAVFSVIFSILVLGTDAWSANTVCHEKDGISRFHINWMGGELPEENRENLERLCQDIKKQTNEGRTSEQFKILLWGNARNFEKVLKNPGVCEGLVEEHLADELLKKHSWAQDVYSFWMSQEIYAGASDILRPLMLREYGGCYLDSGFRIKEASSLILKLLNTYPSADFFVYKDWGAKIWPDKGTPKNLLDEFYKSFRFFNSFMAAQKDSPTLHHLMQDFEFKADLLKKNRSFFQGLAEYCDNGPLVMMLTGQFAFQQSLFNSTHNKNSAIQALSLGATIPYNGKSSWKRNGTQCDLFLACTYPKVISAYPAIAKDSILDNPSPESNALDIVNEMIVSATNATKENGGYPAKELISEHELKAISEGIKRQAEWEKENITQDKCEQICKGEDVWTSLLMKWNDMEHLQKGNAQANVCVSPSSVSNSSSPQIFCTSTGSSQTVNSIEFKGCSLEIDGSYTSENKDYMDDYILPNADFPALVQLNGKIYVLRSNNEVDELKPINHDPLKSLLEADRSHKASGSIHVFSKEECLSLQARGSKVALNKDPFFMDFYSEQKQSSEEMEKEKGNFYVRKVRCMRIKLSGKDEYFQVNIPLYKSNPVPRFCGI